MTTPPLNALRVFEAVARLGSFGAAAEQLCVTQSAVSHQIRRVEDWIGKPLFEREGNRNRLLPEGAELARNLAKSLADIEAACNKARDINQTLVVATIPSVAMCWLIPRLDRFRANNPEIDIRIVYAIHGQTINFSDVHMAFTYAASPPSGPTIESHYFFSAQSVPVCSPSRLRHLDRMPETVADFIELGLLHDRTPTGWTKWLSESDSNLAEQTHPYPNLGTTYEDFNLLRAAALSGHGVALCPLAMIQSDLDSGALIQVSGQILNEGYDYYLLCSSIAPRRIKKHMDAFLKWALAERSNA